MTLWREEERRHKLPEHPDMVRAREAAEFPPPHATAYEVLGHYVVQAPEVRA